MLTRNPRRIITRGVIDMATSAILEQDSYIYDGPLALADSPSLEPLTRAIEEVGTAAKAANIEVTKQLATISAQTTAQAERILDLEQKIADSSRSRGRGQGEPSLPTFGALISQDEKFQAFIKGNGDRASIRIKQSLGTILKSVLTNTGQSGDSPQVNFPTAPEFISPSPLAAPGRRLLVLQALAHMTVGTATAVVPKVTDFSDGSAPQQHEGAVKAESTISVASDILQMPTIATYLNLSKQVMRDAPSLMEFLNSWLRFYVLRKLENLIIYGDGGATDKILGLINAGTDFTPTEDHGIDRIGEACALALPNYGYTAGLIILNNLDYLRILAQRDLNGRYVGGGWMAGLNTSLWGIPAVSSPGCPVGTAIVLDPSLVQILDREEINIAIGWQNQQFVSNEATLLAELRANLAVNDPHAVQIVPMPVNSPNTVG